jgi:peroxiredoxin family protein
MSKTNPDAPKKLALIASRGTLDWAYPPFILASGAAAMGWDVTIFFTFYGLTLLSKQIDPLISPLGNPAMPMRLPFGPPEFQQMNIPIPQALMVIPGFNNLATSLMQETFKKNGVASIQELRDVCIEADVQMVACQMTMDVFGFKKEDFIPECTVGGVGTFLDFAADADVQLFV